MNKVKKLIFTLALFLMLSGCGVINCIMDDLLSIPDDVVLTWQTVNISGVGSFLIPAEWCVEQQDSVLYITDKPRDNEGYSLYIIGTVRTGGPNDPYVQPHELLDEVVKGKSLWAGVIYANSAGYGMYEYVINDESGERYLIDWHSSNERVYLLAWDMDVVDEFHVINIAKTFFGSERVISDKLT